MKQHGRYKETPNENDNLGQITIIHQTSWKQYQINGLIKWFSGKLS